MKWIVGKTPSLVSLALVLAVPAAAQQDSKPRVYFETQIYFDPLAGNTLGRTFTTSCPGAIVTENRSKADYVVRLTARAGYGKSIDYSLTILGRDGDQIFSDFMNRPTAATVSGMKNPYRRFDREACAVIVYKMDNETLHGMIGQAELRPVQAYYVVKLENVELTPKKMTDEFADETRLLHLLGRNLVDKCFWIQGTRVRSNANYLVQINLHKTETGSLTGSLTILDRSGKEIFSRSVPPLADGACEAILLREQR